MSVRGELRHGTVRVLALLFPKLTTPGSALADAWLQRRSGIGDLPGLSATGSTIAILRCSEEHGGTVGPSTVFLAMQVRVGEDHE